jgi:hypothetical protein
VQPVCGPALCAQQRDDTLHQRPTVVEGGHIERGFGAAAVLDEALDVGASKTLPVSGVAWAQRATGLATYGTIQGGSSKKAWVELLVNQAISSLRIAKHALRQNAPGLHRFGLASPGRVRVRGLPFAYCSVSSISASAAHSCSYSSRVDAGISSHC